MWDQVGANLGPIGANLGPIGGGIGSPGIPSFSLDVHPLFHREEKAEDGSALLATTQPSSPAGKILAGERRPSGNGD